MELFSEYLVINRAYMNILYIYSSSLTKALRECMCIQFTDCCCDS